MISKSFKLKLWWEKSVLLVGKGLGKAKLVGKGLHRLVPVNIVLIKIQKNLLELLAV